MNRNIRLVTAGALAAIVLFGIDIDHSRLAFAQAQEATTPAEEQAPTPLTQDELEVLVARIVLLSGRTGGGDLGEQALGEALSYQQKDVLTAIQQLRAKAVADGIIKSDDKVKVVEENEKVIMMPRPFQVSECAHPHVLCRSKLKSVPRIPSQAARPKPFWHSCCYLYAT